MKNRLETMAWLQELKAMNVVELVKAIDAYYEDLSNELPAPPAEVYVDVDAPVVVEEAPTIEEYIAPKVGDKIVIDDPRYNYYPTEIPSDQHAFLLRLSDALSNIEDIKHDSMVHGDEDFAQLYWFTLPPKEGCSKPYRVHNKVVLDVYKYDPKNEDADPILVRSCEFYINQLPNKIANTLVHNGIFRYDGKTGYPEKTLQLQIVRK